MTSAKGTGRKANNNASQSPNGNKADELRASNLYIPMWTICATALLITMMHFPRIQEMLRDQPGLDQSSATAVAITRLLLPFMGMTN